MYWGGIQIISSVYQSFHILCTECFIVSFRNVSSKVIVIPLKNPMTVSEIRIRILAFSTNFCPIKSDLSGNTVWPQASDFQKIAKTDLFGIFN